jgi:hypothetical protein
MTVIAPQVTKRLIMDTLLTLSFFLSEEASGTDLQEEESFSENR